MSRDRERRNKRREKKILFSSRTLVLSFYWFNMRCNTNASGNPRCVYSSRSFPPPPPLRFYIFLGDCVTAAVGLNIIKSNRGRGASLDSNRYKRRIPRRAGDSRRTNFAEHERLAGRNDNIGYVFRSLRGGVPPRLERKERLVPVRGVDRNKRKRRNFRFFYPSKN